MIERNSARWLTLLLGASFLLTITSFGVSRIVSEYQLRGTRHAAETISEHALPANEALSSLRSELRRSEAIVDRLAETPRAPEQTAALRAEFAQSRSAMNRTWDSYRTLPMIPGERELQVAVQAQFVEMDAAVATALQRLEERDRSGAADALERRARPAIARADESVRHAADLNRRTAIEAAVDIAQYRRSARVWGLALDGLSTTLALAAAYFVLRVIRRFWASKSERVAELEQFAGRVAHDIRSPLGTVTLAVDCAKRQPGLNLHTQTLLDRAMRTMQRVSQLVDGLLLFAIAGKPPAAASGTCAQEVIDDVVRDALSYAREKGVTLEWVPPSEPLRIACNPGVLVSMASNLVSNALKYIGDSPVREVAINARAVGDSIRIEVCDTGPGIAPELRERVFDPHVRGADSAIPGLGLGLATVRRLAEAHGGHVGVRANAPAGCVFWFEMPRFVEQEATPRASKRSRSGEVAYI